MMTYFMLNETMTKNQQLHNHIQNAFGKCYDLRKSVFFSSGLA